MRTESIEAPSLEAFYDDNLIVDVLGPVKSGKEATVYCCEAHRSVGVELLAAKVYRPLSWRSFRNDAVYQEGRVILDARLRRAYRKKTRTGREVQSGLWVGREFEALRALHEAGASVPRPVARSGPAVLMEYVGGADSPQKERYVPSTTVSRMLDSDPWGHTITHALLAPPKGES